MPTEDSWLFFKSSIFTYANKISLLIFSILYTYVIANALGPEKYGLAMFVLAFVGNLVYLFGVEAFSKTLVVFIPKYRSKKLFIKFAKLLLFGFLFLFVLFFLFSQQVALILKKSNATFFKSAAFLFISFPIFLLFEALFKGLKSFGKVLKVSLVESLTNLAFATLFIIILQLGVNGVIFGKIISLMLASLLYFYFFNKQSFEERKINTENVKKYLKNTFAVSVLKKLNVQVMLLYMGMFISDTFLGLYYIAEKIVSYAIETPISALSETMLPFASEKSSNRKALSKFVSLNIKFTLILGIILGLTVVFFGRFMLAYLFPKYAEAHRLLPFFVVIFLGTITNFFHGAYRSINRVDVLTKLWAIVLFTTIILGYFLISWFSILGLLSLRIINNIIAGAFLYFNQKKVGLQIEIIPRFRDLRFFASVFKRAVKRIRSWARSKARKH